MWLQQAESISQKERDIPDETERREIRCITNHTNGISNDVLKVNYGNGDSRSRRLGLCEDRSHWLDTLSVSNSSNRNGNN